MSQEPNHGSEPKPSPSDKPPAVPLEPVVLLSDVLEVFRKRNDIPQDLKPIPPRSPGHGPCCCCMTCGRYHDECVCQLNELLAELLAIPKQNPRADRMANEKGEKE